MKAWLWNHKLYIVHAAVVAIVFLDPSVKAYILAHPEQSMTVGTVWGFLLHWATGK